MPKKVTIITVNYNQPKATEELLDSILTTEWQPLLDVIVIDNGSIQNPIPGWEKKYPMFSFIRSDENLGFAGGNNLGIKLCGSEYIFLINNDTIVTENLVSLLVNFLDSNPDYGVVSPKIRYFDKPEILQYAGFTKMNFFTGRNKCIGQYEIDRGQYDQLPTLTYFAHGAAMMLRREVVEKAGLMPEIFFLYYEEMDWCESIKRSGAKIGLCMKALVFHKESLATGKNSRLKDYYMYRNRLLFIRRNGQPQEILFFYFYFITILYARFVIDCIKLKEPSRIPLYLKTLWWNITHSARKGVTGN